MIKVPMLWASGARKEVMELLRTLWTQADPQTREALGVILCAGPPAELFTHLDAVEREESRDRRIFDRLVVLERLGNPPLTAALEVESVRLRATHPHWRAPDGERAHFDTWFEMSWGADTRYSVEDLQALDDPTLIKILIGEAEKREGLLDNWRQLGDAAPARVITILEQLNRREPPAPVDVWDYGLSGMRANAKQLEFGNRLVRLLQSLPDALFDQPMISSAVADILDAVTNQPSPPLGEDFWQLFDRTLAAAALDLSNSDPPSDRHGWVTLALNQSMGRIAIAFFTALFARNLTVGGGIPADMMSRLDALLAREKVAHRSARVIAASRLSYLHAVDPAWTQANLIPNFDWTDEEEALAVWQGYAWHARIDRNLWSVLKPHFLAMFTLERLERLGDATRNFAQMLMLVGIEFGRDELPREAVRNALRVMPEAMRVVAIAWVTSLIEEDDADENPLVNMPLSRADRLWSDRIWPWLDRVWPPEPASQSEDTAERFALIAVATDSRFPDAVQKLRPYYMIMIGANYVVDQLNRSKHPDDHPRETSELLDAIVNPSEIRLGGDELRSIIQRIRKADPDFANRPAFRKWAIID